MRINEEKEQKAFRGPYVDTHDGVEGPVYCTGVFGEGGGRRMKR